MTTIVAPPRNVIKWQMGFKSAFNPLPLLFKAVLNGQKDCVFFSGHLIYILKQERFGALGTAKG
jgi:hypothetical protein